MSIGFNRLCFVALFRHHHFILPLNWNFAVNLEIILMTVILLLLALLAAAGSAMFVSEATLGVWVMAGAIFLVALARVAQASAHHTEMRALIRKETVPAIIPNSDSLPQP